MGSGEWIDSAASVRREIDDAVFDVVKDLMAAGWRLRRQGHKFYIYCTCDEESTTRGRLRVDGTPRNPGTAARRLRRDAAKCPDRHELM